MIKNVRKLQRFLLILGLVVFNSLTVLAQEKSLTGTVTDASGGALPGVSVVIKGTTTGTISDIEGNYSLNVDMGKAIVFSFLGMKSQEIQYTGQMTIDIVMIDDALQMDELVVVGYGTQKKKTLTGAVGSIKSDDLVQRPVSNTTQLLQGQIAGLQTRQSNGLPGADEATLSIRGFGTPLVLVDGMQSSMANVDPNDIETISVLKDGAAAIYGARGGNGVILVTTKRGKKGDAKIEYHGNMSFTQPTFRPKHVNAGQWAELMHEAGKDPNASSPNHVVYDPETNKLTNAADGSIFEGYNWSESIMKDWVAQQQHNVSARGGSENVSYFVSMGFVDQASNFKSGDYEFQRYNVRANIDAKINKNLSIKADFVYRKNTIDKANFDVEKMYNDLQTAKPVYSIEHEADPKRASWSGFVQRSPYAQTLKEFSGSIENKTSALLGNLELKYDIPFVKGLSATAQLKYEDIYVLNKKVSKPFDVWSYDQLAAEANEDPWGYHGTQNINSIMVTSHRTEELLPSFRINYERSFGEHNVQAFVLTETRTYLEESLQGSRKDLLSFDAPFLDYAANEIDNSEGKFEHRRSSFVGRLNYDYASKYLFEFIMRADASANYPKGSRWGYFPGVSAGWRLSEESFIKDNLSFVDNLKLRGSYAQIGKDQSANFRYLAGYVVSDTPYVLGDSPAQNIYPLGLPNPNTTWEKMTMTNVGLDATLWSGKFGFEFDYFYRSHYDILSDAVSQVPNTFGSTPPRLNTDEKDNRGFEIVLSHHNQVGDFKYSISPMFSWARSKWVKKDEDISDDPEYNRRHNKTGRWADEKWGYLSDGFFMNQDEIDNHLVDQDQNGNQTILPGDIKYKDVNGDNVIDWRDEAVIGKSGLPKINYGLKLDAEYKNFNLYMLFQGATDYMVTFSGSAAAPFSNESIPLDYHYDNRMILEKDENGRPLFVTNPGAALPAVSENGLNSNNKKASDFWSYDAHFFRLKNVNLSYTLPKDIVKRAGIDNCQFYVSATNLWTVSNLGIFKDSFDPEEPGANNRDYPNVKTITLGIKLSL